VIGTSDPTAALTVVAGAGRPAWWVVLRRELAELWVGGRALNLLLLFAILMSGTAFLLATNSELSLTPPRLMMVVALQATTSFGLFIGLIVGAESISGERERATLEALLLTPADRRQIVLGKYLAAISPWPAALLVALPYVIVLAQRDVALDLALMWSAALGTLLVFTFTGIGMVVSILSGSSRTSLFVGLLVYLLTLLPAQLPGEFASTAVGALVRAVDPLESVRQFLTAYLVDGYALDEARVLLIAPTVAFGAVLAVVIGVAAPRVGLAGGRVTPG
jgi:ABC-2 type transport system permease protein